MARSRPHHVKCVVLPRRQGKTPSLCICADRTTRQWPSDTLALHTASPSHMTLHLALKTMTGWMSAGSVPLRAEALRLRSLTWSQESLQTFAKAHQVQDAPTAGDQRERLTLLSLSARARADLWRTCPRRIDFRTVPPYQQPLWAGAGTFMAVGVGLGTVVVCPLDGPLVYYLLGGYAGSLVGVGFLAAVASMRRGDMRRANTRMWDTVAVECQQAAHLKFTKHPGHSEHPGHVDRAKVVAVATELLLAWDQQYYVYEQ